GKSNVKYRDYAAFGIPAIYSDMSVYRASVRDGVNGLLTANSEPAVAAAIDRLVGDRTLRRRIRAAALADAAANYSLSAMQRALLHEFSGLAAAAYGRPSMEGTSHKVSMPGDDRATVARPDPRLARAEPDATGNAIVEPPIGSPQAAVRLVG